MIVRCSKLNWVLNLVFKKHQQHKVTSWGRINRIGNTELKPHPCLRCNPLVWEERETLKWSSDWWGCCESCCYGYKEKWLVLSVHLPAKYAHSSQVQVVYLGGRLLYVLKLYIICIRMYTIHIMNFKINIWPLNFLFKSENCYFNCLKHYLNFRFWIWTWYFQFKFKKAYLI
jgi:hypothetical protein